jgi:predicted TIM-barrel fold metal-dependent hydrolase
MQPNYHLISSDSHVNEPPDLWVDRVPAALRDRVPRIEHFEQGDAWVVEGVAGPMPFGLNACAGQDFRLRQAWVRFDELRPGGYNPAARLAELDQAGVDAEVLYPTPRLMQSVYATTDVGLHVALVRAYNDWISEYADHDLTRFRALPVIPNRGIDHAMAEIERVGGRRSTGGFLIGAFSEGTLQPTAADDAVFASLVERHLPLNIHVSLSTTMPGLVNASPLPAAGRFNAATAHLIDFIFSGAFDRFPDLQVVFAEVDCGWVPYFKEQLDDGYQRYRHRLDLQLLPSEYVERHVHFGFVSDTYGIDNRHRIGVERMLWSSDYPHGNSNWPSIWPPVQAAMTRVPNDERQLMLVGNSSRLYGFGKA